MFIHIFKAYLLVGLIFLGGCVSNPQRLDLPYINGVVKKYKSGTGFYLPIKGRCVFVTAHHVEADLPHKNDRNTIWADPDRDIVVKDMGDACRKEIQAGITQELKPGVEVILSGYPKGKRKKRKPYTTIGRIIKKKIVIYGSYEVVAYQVATGRNQWGGGNSGGLVCLPEANGCRAVGVIIARSNPGKGEYVYFSPFPQSLLMPRMAQK